MSRLGGLLKSGYLFRDLAVLFSSFFSLEEKKQKNRCANKGDTGLNQPVGTPVPERSRRALPGIEILRILTEAKGNSTIELKSGP
jgi:hypothetical protein